MFEQLTLYRHLIAARIRGQMQYRVSFGLALLGTLLLTIIEFIGIAIFFSRVPSVAGWSLCEVALLYALAQVTFATAEFVGSALDDFNIRINYGLFDRVLTRPHGTFFQVLADDLALRRIGRIGQGLIVLVFALRCAESVWTADKVLVLLLALLSGTVIFFSILVLAAAFCFWTVEGKEATHVFSYGGVTLTSYPLDIYYDSLRRLITFVLPLAFVSYYPTLYLLDRPDPLGMPDWLRLLSPIAAVFSAGLAWLSWQVGVRHYQSTGIMSAVIRTVDLRKTFRVARRRPGFFGALRGMVSRDARDVHAVDGISLSIDVGEMVACLGPNGAGKSTTIKMLTGILVPSRGRAEVFGLVPHQQRRSVTRRIGVVFGQRTQLWWDLPLVESFDLLRHMYGVPEQRFRENLKQFRELLELDSFLDTPVRQLSLGQRMRGDLAAALLHDPEVLYLDEPTIGLDVVAKHRIRLFLHQLNRERNVTVLLTTHDMTDVERLCSRLLIIDHGRLLYDGGLDEMRQALADECLLIVDLDAEDADLESLCMSNATQVRVEGPRHWLRFRRSQTTAGELISTLAARYRLRDVRIEETAVEDMVRRFYEETPRVPSLA